MKPELVVLKGLDLYQATVQKKLGAPEEMRAGAGEIQEANERAWLQQGGNNKQQQWKAAPPVPMTTLKSATSSSCFLQPLPLNHSCSLSSLGGCSSMIRRLNRQSSLDLLATMATTAVPPPPISAMYNRSQSTDTFYSYYNQNPLVLQLIEANPPYPLAVNKKSSTSQPPLPDVVPLSLFLAMAPQTSSSPAGGARLGMYKRSQSHESCDTFFSQSSQQQRRVQDFMAMSTPPLPTATTRAAEGMYNWNIRSQSEKMISTTTAIPKAVFVCSQQTNQQHPTPIQAETWPAVNPPQAASLPAVSLSLSEQLSQVRKRRLELLQLQEETSRQQHQENDQKDHQVDGRLTNEQQQHHHPLTKPKAAASCASTATTSASTTSTYSSGSHGHGGLFRHSPVAASARTASTSAAAVVDHSLLAAVVDHSLLAPAQPRAASASESSFSRYNNKFQTGTTTTTEDGTKHPPISILLLDQEQDKDLNSSGLCSSFHSDDSSVRRQIMAAHGKKLQQQLLRHRQLEQVAKATTAAAMTAAINQHSNNNSEENKNLATMQQQVELLSARTKNLYDQVMLHQRLETEAAASAPAVVAPTTTTTSGPFYQPPSVAFSRNQAISSSNAAGSSRCGIVQHHLQQQQHQQCLQQYRAPATMFPQTTTTMTQQLPRFMQQQHEPSFVMGPCSSTLVVNNDYTTKKDTSLPSSSLFVLEQVLSEQQNMSCKKRRKIG